MQQDSDPWLLALACSGDKEAFNMLLSGTGQVWMNDVQFIVSEQAVL